MEKTLIHSIFKKQTPVISADLTSLTMISLETWRLIRLHGTDSIQCLHNQLTCDVKNLNKHQYSFAAHCNVQGKMIANMYVFHFKNQEIAYIIPRKISKKQISEIQKYAIFSNVIVTPEDNIIIIGITGLNARKYLNTLFTILPDRINTVIHHPDVIMLYFDVPIERFLLIIINKSYLITLLNKAKLFFVQYNNHNQWTALDIESGYPYIDSETSERFFPQSVNLDTLKGISFNKGCFIGQEIIARIQYRKLNKHALYHLISKPNQNINISELSPLLPLPGDCIELQINNQHWKNIGTVLQACQIKKNYIWIQAILNKLTLNAQPRLRIHTSKLEIMIST